MVVTVQRSMGFVDVYCTYIHLHISIHVLALRYNHGCVEDGTVSILRLVS
jgi:hypothetical protein